MTLIVAGIALPESTLTSPWFLVFAAFVGVNTIIYVGLTLSRLIPWPRPVHPRSIRALFGMKTPASKEAAVPLRPNVSRETPSESGVHDIARAFGWLGAIMLVSACVLVFLGTSEPPQYMAIGAGLLFLAMAQIVSVTKMRPSDASWLWSLAVSVLAVATAMGAASADLELIGYMLVIIVVIGAVSLNWPSYLFGTAAVLGATVALGLKMPVPFEPALVTPAIAAAIAGALMLALRRRYLRVLEDVDRLENQLGSTDALSGVLTRQGLITLGPTVRRTAERAGQPMFVMIVDIDHLGTANRDFGMGYGDELLRTVAQILRTAARDADLLGRWSGDEFALMGIGADESIAALTRRIKDAIGRSAVSMGKPPLNVSIGTAVSSAEGHVETLVERAMYNLRHSAAGAGEEPDATFEEVPKHEPTTESEPEPKDEPAAAPEPAADPYRASDTDFALWVCADCLHQRTCAKAGVSTPATCGNFQWR